MLTPSPSAVRLANGFTSLWKKAYLWIVDFSQCELLSHSVLRPRPFATIYCMRRLRNFLSHRNCVEGALNLSLVSKIV